MKEAWKSGERWRQQHRRELDGNGWDLLPMLRPNGITRLESRVTLFCRWVDNRRKVLLAPGKERSGEGDVNSRIQVQLEEDGGSGTEQSSRCRRVVCDSLWETQVM